MNALADFETALKNHYSCEIELKHSKDIQDIIDRCGFTHIDFINYCGVAPCFRSTKINCVMKDYFSFHSGVFAMGHLIDTGNKRFCYIFAGDVPFKSGSLVIPFVVIFPLFLEKQYYHYLSRLESLKAFL